MFFLLTRRFPSLAGRISNVRHGCNQGREASLFAFREWTMANIGCDRRPVFCLVSVSVVSTAAAVHKTVFGCFCLVN